MKRRIITRTVWILSLVSMFADVASEMLYPVIPVYLRNIGFSVFIIGILEGIAEAAAGLSKGFFGKWSDHLGRRMPFVRLGYFLSALAKPMMVILKLPWWIFFARTTDRLGKGLRTAPRDALLSAGVGYPGRRIRSYHCPDLFIALSGKTDHPLLSCLYSGGHCSSLYFSGKGASGTGAGRKTVFRISLLFQVLEKSSFRLPEAAHSPYSLCFVQQFRYAAGVEGQRIDRQ